MPVLAFEIDDTMDDDNLDDNDLYDGEDLARELPDLDADEDDVLCPECGEVIEDGVQCTFCGYIVNIL
jgi:hypothetical protein